MADGRVITEVYVSWDGTAAFSGPYDRVTPDTAGDPGLALDAGLDGLRALSPPKIVALDFELFNHDGTYSQNRPGSPVYQRVLPGRPINVQMSYGDRRAYRADAAYRADHGYRGTIPYTMARTHIDDIAQTTTYGEQRVRIGSLGLESTLNNTTVSVALTQNIRVDQAIALVLDAAGWPSGARRLAISDTMLRWFWVDDRTPWSVLLELLAAEGPGLVYVDGDATFVFENRNYRATAAHATTSQAVLFDRGQQAADPYRSAIAYRDASLYRGGAAALWFTALEYDPGFKSIRNRATYRTEQRTAGPLGPVWTYQGDLLLGGVGSVRTVVARPNDPFINPVVPVAGTDFTATGGTVSVTVNAASGFVAFVTFTTTAGTPTLTGVQLRAQPVVLLEEVVVTNAIDASESIDTFSPVPGAAIPQMLQVAGWPCVDVSVAEAVCDAWVARYMEPRPAVTVTLRNADDRHARLLLETRVSDRLTISERNTGLQTDVWVNTKRVIVGGAGGRAVVCELGCEQVEGTIGFVWDGGTTLWDTALWGR